MRVLAYFVIIIGLGLLGLAAYQEWSGVTTRPLARGASIVLDPWHIDKASDPERFRSAMAVHWLYASVTTFLGVALLLIIRGQDCADPLAPDADSKDDEDDVKQ